MRRELVVNVLLAAALALVVVTVVGLALLWPEQDALPRPPGLAPPTTERAEIVGVRRVPCSPGQAAGEDCVRVAAELLSGPDEGREVEFTAGAVEGQFAVGDEIRMFPNNLPEGANVGGVPLDPYSFSDFERRPPILWLTAIFAAIVLVTGRWQGLRALAGLGASLAVVIFFIVPAILEGRSPVGVAFVGALAVMLVTLPLAHGVGPKTLAACLGTAVSLTLVLVLARLFTDLAHLTGVSSEEAAYLRATQSAISLQGLLLAGMVIGALGVLDDLTVSQSSTVMALRRANPALGFRELFRSALAVGHDHIAATVNTLVLAYAGAALPVLLIFSLADTSLGDAVNFEAVSEAVVAMLVGSIGLIAAVPVTTALASVLALRLEPAALDGVPAGHAH